MKNVILYENVANSLLIGILYVSNSKKIVDLSKLVPLIEKEISFFVEFVADEYFIKMKSNVDDSVISIYFDGTVYYQRKLDIVNLTSLEIFNTTKEGYGIIGKLLPKVKYQNKITLSIKGNHINGIYQKYKYVINEFGFKLFKNPIFRELETKKDCIDISIVSEDFLNF